jgi:polyisoprenoid-binding protein YceI
MSTTASSSAIPTGTYNVDPSHSNVGFEVKHMGIATVRGTFRKFEGTVDATGKAPRLEGTVEVASIDTGEENRDGHLKAPDFFDADRYPQITLHSTATDAAENGSVRLLGEITI